MKFFRCRFFYRKFDSGQTAKERKDLNNFNLSQIDLFKSIDGNLNTQKLSNRSRLMNHFEFECSREEPVISEPNKMVLIRPSRLRSNREKTSSTFKLFAVVMHSGASLNSGHYTAFVNYKLTSDTKIFDGLCFF